MELQVSSEELITNQRRYSLNKKQTNKQDFIYYNRDLNHKRSAKLIAEDQFLFRKEF